MIALIVRQSMVVIQTDNTFDMESHYPYGKISVQRQAVPPVFTKLHQIFSNLYVNCSCQSYW